MILQFSRFKYAALAVLMSAAATLVPAAKADNIASFTAQVTSSSLKELGRPYRSGTPQDWSGSEPYDGVTLPTNTYFYTTYTFSQALFAGREYVDISTFDPTNGSSYFIAAYATSYNVNSRGTNWLGDAGFSGNYQTNDGGDFQVLLAPGQDLVLVVNSTGTGAAVPTYGLNVNVDAYSDSGYSAGTTPEPSSLIMAGTGLVGLFEMVRRRRVAQA